MTQANDLPLEVELVAASQSRNLISIMRAKDGEAFCEWVADNALTGSKGMGIYPLIGVLKGIQQTHPALFGWAMYQLCCREGFEDVVSAYWIAIYEMTKNEDGE